MGKEDIYLKVICPKCKRVVKRDFRFTDWENSENDRYGELEECKKLFDEARKKEPEKRVSIYALANCPICEEQIEEQGVLFNENCPDYKINKGGETKNGI